MYSLDTTGAVTVQEEIGGGATFTGVTELGRAKLTMGQLRFAAKLLGTAANSYQVQLVDPGVNGTLRVRQLGVLFQVTLARTAGSLSSTPQHVAEAINAANLPIVAAYTGSTLLTAVAATPLTGGLDPVRVGNRFEWVRGTGVDGGFFYFEQQEPILIRSLGVRLATPGGLVNASFGRVNLTKSLEVVAGSYIPDREFQFDPTHTFYSVGDMRLVLDRYEALVVKVALEGTVKVTVQRSTFFPYS